MKNLDCDVIVVGYGAAGASSAIAASDHGAKVIILEKMVAGGGNSIVSGGNFIIPRSIDFALYLDKLSYGTTDSETNQTYVREAISIGDWIRDLGGELIVYKPRGNTRGSINAGASFPNAPGAELMDKYNIKEPTTEPASVRLWNLLSENVERRQIQVLTNTPVKELIRNKAGEIVGVIAEHEGSSIQVNSRRAVIITCGGFENDETLKWDNLPCKPIKFLGNPGNTGDGIKMTEAVGAAMWHMTSLSCLIGFQAPGYEAAFPIMFLNPGFIFIDKHGRRFINETGIEVHEYWRELALFNPDQIEYPRIPFYAIFDEDTRTKAPIGIRIGYQRDSYSWSVDNSVEIANGWIISASTIDDLANKIEIDGSTLNNTIAKYNEFCRIGIDEQYDRARDSLAAIINPPYYAIELYPALLNTQGGPQRDKKSRILDAYGEPIPRLYAAGELGSIWGFLYQGGNNLGECLVFGRIAGRNAATEKPITV